MMPLTVNSYPSLKPIIYMKVPLPFVATSPLRSLPSWVQVDQSIGSQPRWVIPQTVTVLQRVVLCTTVYLMQLWLS
jgi:hypothetical protein